MRLEDVPSAALDELIEDLSDLRHDLGKYLIFEVRFLGEAPETEALRAALRADILQTHKRGDEHATAWQVWAGLRPALLDGDVDIVQIEESLMALAGVDLSGSRAELDQAAALAGEVATATRSLCKRALLMRDALLE
ncbi:MAG: hypothetical protein ACI8RZ_004626 [Myxococcota bacterium]